MKPAHAEAGGDDIGLRAGVVADLALLLDIDLDAGQLFERAGLALDLPDDHEFPVTERARFAASLAAGAVLIATESDGRPIGFVAMGARDGAPYVEQLSVRAEFTRRRIGARLLSAGLALAAARGTAPCWLTTYDHLAWNRPFYERHGFVGVPDASCAPEIRAELDFQRRWLPLPERRVAMRHDPRH